MYISGHNCNVSNYMEHIWKYAKHVNLNNNKKKNVYTYRLFKCNIQCDNCFNIIIIKCDIKLMWYFYAILRNFLCDV